MAADLRPMAVALVLSISCIGLSSGEQYLGKLLGKLTELHHGVSGEVYAVDGRTLYIKDFTYDGQAPAAYFFAGNSRAPSKDGFRIPDEKGGKGILRRYRKEPVTITLPDGKTLRDIKWFSVWCEEFEVNFGDVKIPRNFDYPRPQKLDPLRGVHAISSDNVVVVDAQTLLVPNLSFDGEPPDAKFWVGRGPRPSPQGIRVPDENGKETPLRRYDRKTVVLTLPGDLTVFDIGHFGIWCEAFTVDFGHIQIPPELNVPPSLKMLGVSPQSKLNCEVLYDDLAFEVRWAVAGDSIVLQLVAKLDQREYMSFGVSGETAKSVMIGGDVVVAWVDKETLKGYAVDYFLEDKSQCSGRRGSCPDERIAPNTDSIRLLNAAMVNGYSIVTYQRPLRASDDLDKPIYTNQSQAVIWAIGPLNERDEVSFHTHYLKSDRFIDFGRPASWNCPMPESDSSQTMRAALVEEPSTTTTTTTTTTEAPTRSRSSERRRGGTRRQQQVEVRDSEDSASQPARSRHQTGRRGVATTSRPVPTPAAVKERDAWEIPPIQCYEPEDGVFYAQMGPTGGKRGYPAITGHVGWGISWYINGLLIPEIYVVRGKTYNFVVEGGSDPDIPAKYHPFYITDDPIGGYEYKTAEEKKNVRIFAGVRKGGDGTLYPTGVGRLCHWTHQGDKEADDYESFGAFQRSLELKCDAGEPGVIQWTPDDATPDTVYYQCFTHRYLGWKIHVIDSCDTQTAASELHPAIVLPEDPLEESGDLEGSSSIIVETRVKPNDINTDVKNVDKPRYQVMEEFEEMTTEKAKEFSSKLDRTQSQEASIDMTTTVNPSTTESIHLTNETSVKSVPSTITTFPQKDIAGYQKLVIRRPEAPLITQNKPYVPDVPMKIVMRPVLSSRPYHMSQTFKKPYRPIGKPSGLNRPVRMPYPIIDERPVYMMKPKRPQHVLLIKPLNDYMVLNHIFRQSTIQPETPTTPRVKHIEISPQQSSTEKEPEMATSKPYVTLAKPHYPGYKVRPAVNTGFRPESIVIEGGFKPILSKEIEDRKSGDEGPQLEYESEIGVINVSTEKVVDAAPSVVQSFEPMFVPSPLEKVVTQKPLKMRKRAPVKKNQVVFIIKEGRSMDDETLTDDEIAEAAERVDSYYLPPPDKKLKLSSIPQKPSDIDTPPGTVVTYDGKKVSSASLTTRIADRSVALESRVSKAAELIRAGPQFVPFKGDLPPLDPKLMNTDVPQLKARAAISRELDAPSVSSGPTKLSLLGIERRNRREAHHTPEHTAEQNLARQKLGSTRNSADKRAVGGVILLLLSLMLL